MSPEWNKRGLAGFVASSHIEPSLDHPENIIKATSHLRPARHSARARFAAAPQVALSALDALVAFAAVAALSGCASTAPDASGTSAATSSIEAPAKIEHGMLADAKRITLYTYDSDRIGSGKSSCNDVCATNWPPFMVDAGARPIGNFTIVTRENGKAQWAFKGMPLYYWPEDQEPGDAYGDKYDKVWHIVKP